MKREVKINFHFLYLHFIFRLFYNDICEDSMYEAQKGYLSISSAMKFNSRRHDVVSIERDVDQSWRLFISDIARLR